MATSPWRLPQCKLCVHTISWNGRHELPGRHSFHISWNWCVSVSINRASPTLLMRHMRQINVASKIWYANSPAAQRANRFTQTLTTVATGVGLGWTFNTPGTSNCTLTATSNLLARVLNGVPVGQECDHIGTTALASGSFLSVEQKGPAREAVQEDQAVWARAVRESFTPVCGSGYKLDGDAVGCVPVSVSR